MLPRRRSASSFLPALVSSRWPLLSASSTTPTWEFDYAYPLPTDPAYCLRVLDVYNPSGYAWKVEGRSILTDIEAPIKIKYIVQVTDPGEMDAMFRDTLAAYLAQEWAENLAKSNEVQASMRKSFETKLFPARSVDGQEGTPDALITNDWTDARY